MPLDNETTIATSTQLTAIITTPPARSAAILGASIATPLPSIGTPLSEVKTSAPAPTLKAYCALLKSALTTDRRDRMSSIALATSCAARATPTPATGINASTNGADVVSILNSPVDETKRTGRSSPTTAATTRNTTGPSAHDDASSDQSVATAIATVMPAPSAMTTLR
ncbi:hypothetical protein [Demequina sp. NBRC 110056]|uniref:hypothetical protein n=1 Tax=Demequina sp. NBRC 110056 TaxID=1570345 RepID=UPI0013564357|nr:hypothetical protein [Demequina sp. NBRC 110056]